MKRWKERLSRFLGSKDRPELDQAEQRGWQHRQQPQGLPPNVPRSNGKPPRRPPAPMSQGSVRGSRASYDNSMLGRPSGSSRHPAFGPGGAGLEPKVSPSRPGASMPCGAGAVCCLLSWHLAEHARSRSKAGPRTPRHYMLAWSLCQDEGPVCCIWQAGSWTVSPLG